MSYFNKKTDVIKIELTQYGKMLLAKGKFKPAFYQFFDNDVIYDGDYASLQEIRNEIQERIKNNTPYSKPQYNFSGVESKIKRLKELKKELQQRVEFSANKNPNFIPLQNLEEKSTFSVYPLGTSKLNDEYPSITVFSADTEISSSLEYSDLNGYVLHVPQIKMKESEYKIFSRMNSDTPISENQNLTSELFPDQRSYLEFQEKILIFNFNETNVKDLYKNFEIELFEVTSSKGKEIYLPLYFTGQENSEDINSVEHYFQVLVDSEIPTQNIDKIKDPKKQSNLIPRIF